MNGSTTSSEKRRSIFRTEAARRYAQGQATAVLPRLIAPPTFALLWIVLATLALGLLTSWFVKIPIFATGTAVVVQDEAADSEAYLLVAFLPAGSLPDLAADQTIFWQAPDGERAAQTVTAVSPTAISPAKIHEIYPASVATTVSQPSVVLTATLETAVLGSRPASQPGALYPVDVQVGSRRVLSLLPLVGDVFLENGD